MGQIFSADVLCVPTAVHFTSCSLCVTRHYYSRNSFTELTCIRRSLTLMELKQKVGHQCTLPVFTTVQLNLSQVLSLTAPCHPEDNTQLRQHCLNSRHSNFPFKPIHDLVRSPPLRCSLAMHSLRSFLPGSERFCHYQRTLKTYVLTAEKLTAACVVTMQFYFINASTPSSHPLICSSLPIPLFECLYIVTVPHKHSLLTSIVMTEK